MVQALQRIQFKAVERRPRARIRVSEPAAREAPPAEAGEGRLPDGELKNTLPLKQSGSVPASAARWPEAEGGLIRLALSDRSG